MDVNLSYKDMSDKMPPQPDSEWCVTKAAPHPRPSGTDIISTIRVVCCLLLQLPTVSSLSLIMV